MKVSASDVLHALQEAVRGRLEDPLLLDALLGTVPWMVSGGHDAESTLIVGNQRFRITVTEEGPEAGQ
jgi:hypothetical protein